MAGCALTGPRHPLTQLQTRKEQDLASGVAGLAREHPKVDADLLKRLDVLALGVLPEDQLGIGAAVQPAVLIDLGFELTGSPAGVAERQNRPLRAFAARNRLEDVERGGETDAFVDRERRVLDEEVAGMQHEAAAGLDRP